MSEKAWLAQDKASGVGNGTTEKKGEKSNVRVAHLSWKRVVDCRPPIKEYVEEDFKSNDILVFCELIWAFCSSELFWSPVDRRPSVPWVKGIQVYTNKGPGPNQRGDNHKNVNMGV